MPDYKKLQKELDEIKASIKVETELHPIEKWMSDNLGVERLTSKGGSAVVYRHPALKVTGQGGLGHFSIHVKHGRNREFITKHDFNRYLYKRLVEIISFGLSEEQNV